MIDGTEALHSGNLIVQGREFRFEAFVLEKENVLGIGCGRIVKLDVFGKNDECVLSYELGNWFQGTDEDPVKEEIIKLLLAEFRR